jgi:hypothetical protein
MNGFIIMAGWLVVCQKIRLLSHRVRTGNYLHVKFGKGKERCWKKYLFAPFRNESQKPILFIAKKKNFFLFVE